MHFVILIYDNSKLTENSVYISHNIKCVLFCCFFITAVILLGRESTIFVYVLNIAFLPELYTFIQKLSFIESHLELTSILAYVDFWTS